VNQVRSQRFVFPHFITPHILFHPSFKAPWAVEGERKKIAINSMAVMMARRIPTCVSSTLVVSTAYRLHAHHFVAGHRKSVISLWTQIRISWPQCFVAYSPRGRGIRRPLPLWRSSQFSVDGLRGEALLKLIVWPFWNGGQEPIRTGCCRAAAFPRYPYLPCISAARTAIIFLSSRTPPLRGVVPEAGFGSCIGASQ